jgi:light-regulated signal transduction histidine kinase (bacteriophytochrome)
MSSLRSDSQEIIRLLEEELAETNREVVALALELEKRVERRTTELENANRELEAFSYSVSHDLRAPLRAIGGFAALLTQNHAQQMTPDAQRLLGHIVTSAQRMELLIEGLLRLARLGRQAIVHRRIDMNRLVREVLEELSLAQNTHGAEVCVEELSDAIGDPALIKQVLVNLLSNAFKFTSAAKNARIEIGCRREANEEIVYHVRDNGAGFDMRYAEKLFGVFQRLHRAEEYEGTGVGLSLVQRIVQRHEGRIWAEGKLGAGATFYFTLTGFKTTGF